MSSVVGPDLKLSGLRLERVTGNDLHQDRFDIVGKTRKDASLNGDSYPNSELSKLSPKFHTKDIDITGAKDVDRNGCN